MLRANSAVKTGKWKKNNNSGLVWRNRLFLRWYLSPADSNERAALRFAAKCQAAVIFGREGWVGGWILSQLLALLAAYLHVLAIFPVSSAYKDSQCVSILCMSIKTLTFLFYFMFYLCHGAVQCVYVNINWNEERNEWINVPRHVFILGILTWGMRRLGDESECFSHDARCLFRWAAPPWHWCRIISRLCTNVQFSCHKVSQTTPGSRFLTRS